MTGIIAEQQIATIDSLIGSLQTLRGHLAAGRSSPSAPSASKGTFEMPYSGAAWSAAIATRKHFTTLLSQLVNPAQRLGELMFSSATTHSMNAALTLGIYDAVPAEGSICLEDIAVTVGVQAERLAPLLRHCANEGLFEEDNAAWRHTDLSKLLRTDHPLRLSILQAYTRDFIEPSFESLAPCIKGEKSGYEEYRGESVFSFLPKNPSESEKFAVVMQNMNLMVGGPLVEDYDWQHFNGRKIVDVGGGIGAMPALLVEKYPHIAFVVQDLEEPVAQGEKFWAATFPEEIQKRVTFEVHDFFKPQNHPPSDVYLLRFILHDWNDAHCVRILTALRSSVSAGTTLLVSEILIDAENTMWQHTMSLHMLAVFNAQERTQEQYELLLKQTGWRPKATTKTSGPLSMLEAEAV